MKITAKYILKEHLGPLTFSLAALTSLLLLNYIARKFGDLVGKGLPWQAIAQFFVLSVPFTVAMTLPMAVLVSTLYAFSRLASENEITAFKASGVSMGRLLAPVLWGATLMAVTMIFFNDQVLPRANHTLSNLQQDIARTTPTLAIKEQVLNELPGTNYLLRAGHVDNTRSTMREVTLYDMGQASPRTIHADSGALAQMPNGRDYQITLYDGTIEELGDGKTDQLRRTFFDTQIYRMRDVIKAYDPTKPDQNAYKSDREMSICELQGEYMRTRTDYLRAKLDLDIAVADSAKRPPPKSSPRRRVFLGIGRVYCDATRGLRQLGVREAQAQPPASQPPAQPPATQPPATQPPAAQPPRPDSAARLPRPDSAAQPPRADSTRPTPPAPGQPVPATPTPAVPAPAPPVTPAPGVPPGVSSGAGDPGPAVVPPPAATLPAPATPTVEPPAPVLGSSPLDMARLRVADAARGMNDYDVEIHKKFALAIACIVFVLLGAPVALRFPRGGVGLVIGVSLFVFAAYYSFLIAGEELASRGMLPPWIAMWAANVLFTAVGLPLALRMGRESGSARGGGFGEWIDSLRFRLRRADAPANAPAAPAARAAEQS